MIHTMPRPATALAPLLCALLAACGGGSADDSAAGAAAATEHALAKGAGGGGGGGGSMHIDARSIYVIDHPQPGETSMDGEPGGVGVLVLAMLSGSGATPADTVVSIDGVPLIHAPGLAPAYFKINPAGPQPALGADGILHVIASSASAKASRQLDLPCPVSVTEGSSPAPGASLAGVPTLNMGWGAIPWDQGPVAGGPTVTARLRSYDLATSAVGAPISGTSSNGSAISASLPVPVLPVTAGYLSELIYLGVYTLDAGLGSGGVCGRILRLTYAN